MVGLGHVVLQLGGSVELFLTLALNTPTYSYAYHDATVDGLTRLTELMSTAASGVDRHDRGALESRFDCLTPTRAGEGGRSVLTSDLAGRSGLWWLACG